MNAAPAEGETCALRGRVDGSRVAAVLAAEGETLPAVFGTPFMIVDMERACAALFAPHLDPGEVSVALASRSRTSRPRRPVRRSRPSPSTGAARGRYTGST